MRNFLITNEIVLCSFQKDIRNINEKVYGLVLAIDDLQSTYIKEIFNGGELDEGVWTPREPLENGYKLELVNKIEEIRDDIDYSYADLLRNLKGFVDGVLNDFYRPVFRSKKNKKIYEVLSGNISPVEDIYPLNKARQIYRDSKIRRDL